MSNQERHSALVWDQLFELIQLCNESVTDAEVDADLKRLGIDMTSANQRLHKMIAEQRARAKLASAKQTRSSLADQIGDVVAPAIENLRTGVRKLLEGLSGQEQLAYFHKLELAASDEDLQSLL